MSVKVQNTSKVESPVRSNATDMTSHSGMPTRAPRMPTMTPSCSCAVRSATCTGCRSAGSGAESGPSSVHPGSSPAVPASDSGEVPSMCAAARLQIKHAPLGCAEHQQARGHILGEKPKPPRVVF